MEVFRLSREQFANTLSGKGAAIKGARWNSAGVELIYTACNRSLAMAEVAVHFSFATLPTDYVMISIDVPDSIALGTIDESDLPNDWNAFPHPASTQQIGDQFVMANAYAALKIPSVVTRGDYNLLINPYHADFAKIKILKKEKFPFDHRIFK